MYWIDWTKCDGWNWCCGLMYQGNCVHSVLFKYMYKGMCGCVCVVFSDTLCFVWWPLRRAPGSWALHQVSGCSPPAGFPWTSWDPSCPVGPHTHKTDSGNHLTHTNASLLLYSSICELRYYNGLILQMIIKPQSILGSLILSARPFLHHDITVCTVINVTNIGGSLLGQMLWNMRWKSEPSFFPSKAIKAATLSDKNTEHLETQWKTFAVHYKIIWLYFPISMWPCFTAF